MLIVTQFIQIPINEDNKTVKTLPNLRSNDVKHRNQPAPSAPQRKDLRWNGSVAVTTGRGGPGRGGRGRGGLGRGRGAPPLTPANNTAATTSTAANAAAIEAAAATAAAGTNTGIPGTNVTTTGTGIPATPAVAPPPGGLLSTPGPADISNEALRRLLDSFSLLSAAADRDAHAPATGDGPTGGTVLDRSFSRLQHPDAWMHECVNFTARKPDWQSKLLNARHHEVTKLPKVSERNQDL
eukprot:scaffold32206_cov43-Cyclotella_meneghiniana.AAC.6